MSAAREACPVCDGNGFVTVVTQPRVKRLKSAPAVALPRDQAWLLPVNAQDLARVLLVAYSGDRESVASIFERFADVHSQSLSRNAWNAVADRVRSGQPV